jgi:multiple antibiotic resistance protein
MSFLELLPAIGKTTLTLFIIIDPLGNLPIISGLLRGFSPEERRSSVDTSVLVSFLILAGAGLVGREILGLFGVGTGEMLIAGGALFTVIGMDMMFGFLPTGTCDPKTACVVPVATPLLAGPGAITTVLLAVQRQPLPSGYLVAGIAIVVVLVLTWLVLRRVEDLMRVLGERGALIVAKLMGIVVMAIAVSFVVRGVTLVAGQLGAQ